MVPNATGFFYAQESWSKITLLTDNIQEARKRFLTRSARYSGLLNDLEFSDVQFADPIRRKELLADSYAWLAFNVSEQEIVGLAAAGIAAGVKRAIFTTELPPERVNETSIPAFEAAVIAFHEVGGAFTGIRHGTVIAGSEDSAYEIVNATTPCVESTVPRGVLARVVTEALRTDSTHHAVYGVSSSGAFAGAYLNILRASGLSRQQEVEKIFKGGIQRVAQLVQKGKEREQDASEQKSILLEDQIELVTITSLLYSSKGTFTNSKLTPCVNSQPSQQTPSYIKLPSALLAPPLYMMTTNWMSLRTKSSNRTGTNSACSGAPRSCWKMDFGYLPLRIRIFLQPCPKMISGN